MTNVGHCADVVTVTEAEDKLKVCIAAKVAYPVFLAKAESFCVDIVVGTVCLVTGTDSSSTL